MIVVAKSFDVVWFPGNVRHVNAVINEVTDRKNCYFAVTCTTGSIPGKPPGFLASRTAESLWMSFQQTLSRRVLELADYSPVLSQNCLITLDHTALVMLFELC